jgi:hypothetical protein
MYKLVDKESGVVVTAKDRTELVSACKGAYIRFDKEFWIYKDDKLVAESITGQVFGMKIAI